MTHLQAAIGAGLLLILLAAIMVLVVFPSIWIATVIYTVKKARINGKAIDWKMYALATIKGFFWGIMALLLCAGLLYLYLYSVELQLS